MRILGLIPARGGSKGVPRKNIKQLHGKPLIQYTIDAALEARSLAKVVVSTEDEEIRGVSLGLGAEVPFLRPMELASDKSPTIDSVLHAINWFSSQGVEFDALCLLQPTCPLRTTADIDQAVAAFRRQNTDSLISVLPVPHEYNPHWVFELDATKKSLRIATGEDQIIPRRQDLPPAFFRNGAIYLVKTAVLMRYKSLYGHSIGHYTMDANRHINIDTMADWTRAESIITEI